MKSFISLRTGSWLALSLVACHADPRSKGASSASGGDVADASTALVAAPPGDAAAAPEPSASSPLPATEVACSRDDECAVLRVEVAGPRACCPSCATTPATRASALRLREACFGRGSSACPPLACPSGPTRAACRAGRCVATFASADGGISFVPEERRCLPGAACNFFVGCALVTGSAQDGWILEAGDHGRADILGKAVDIGDACFGAGGARRCIPAAFLPLACVSTPLEQQAPRFTCALSKEGRCGTHMQRRDGGALP